jgi:predicted AAA+ superfamily ATPase
VYGKAIMLRRKISDELLRWKERKDKMPLLVKGARQIGKTFSIDAFGREQYGRYIYINFDINPGYKVIFEGDLDIDTLIKQITLRIPGVEPEPGNTLIVLDEIQNCPPARTALKSFSLDRRFDCIATGSLLGINYREVPSFPVGYVEHFNMYSLDFEEFLWANGVSERSIEDLRAYFVSKEKVPQAMHERMMELFKEYIVVGGMPRVVQEFVTTGNFARVLALQRGIIQDYADDIAKYAEGVEKVKARACFFSGPRHLSKDYKKCQYSLVEIKGTARKFAGSLEWLHDAGFVSFCHNLALPELPLAENAQNDVFKVYMQDTGLLVAMLEDGSQEDIIDGRLGIYKGAIYENIIAGIFNKAGKKLYYFEYRSQIEIDFFIRLNKQATAVEVKSADNTKSKSLSSLIKNYGVKQGVKLSAQNNSGGSGVITSFPLYMALFL